MNLSFSPHTLYQSLPEPSSVLTQRAFPDLSTKNVKFKYHPSSVQSLAVLLTHHFELPADAFLESWEIFPCLEGNPSYSGKGLFLIEKHTRRGFKVHTCKVWLDLSAASFLQDGPDGGEWWALPIGLIEGPHSLEIISRKGRECVTLLVSGKREVSSG